MAVEIERSRRLFTADEFERMAEAGVFREEERLELIRGEIVAMSPIGPGHGACVDILTKRFVIGVGDRGVVRVQGVARVALDSMPEPDLALLRPRSYRRANPTPDDVLLVVEVAESSLRYDRIDKLQLYAIAGIREYWVVSVDDEWLEVYRAPEGNGYRESRRLGRDDTIAPLAFPDVVITVAEIFA
jgi:Uma2 family endonuclease